VLKHKFLTADEPKAHPHKFSVRNFTQDVQK